MTESEIIAAIESEIHFRNPRKVSAYEIAFTCYNGSAHKNGDSHPSCHWNIQKHTYTCRVCGVGGGWTGLAKEVGMSLNGSGQRETARWNLFDRTGKYVATHVRVEPGRDGKLKDVYWKINDESGLRSRPLATRPLYGIHLLDKETPSRVFLVEGEKQQRP